MFWIGNHFEADVRLNFADTLSKAIEQGYTKEMLADTLKQQFGDIADKSSHYWQGLLHMTGTPNSFGWQCQIYLVFNDKRDKRDQNRINPASQPVETSVPITLRH